MNEEESPFEFDCAPLPVLPAQSRDTLQFLDAVKVLLRQRFAPEWGIEEFEAAWLEFFFLLTGQTAKSLRSRVETVDRTRCIYTLN